jgi:5-methylcytosine-specific restriction endonuclease McrA
VSDRRYGSSAWQRTRRAILARDARVCMVQGPNCTGIATTVDHIIPTSQGGPFWDPANLRASCKRCNYGRGSSIAAANTRQTIAELRAQLEELWQENQRLAERLSKYELDGRPRKPVMPAIH